MITPAFSLTATERVLPKMALDFTTAVLDPRVTFTRTTSAVNPATYVNSSGVITAAANDQPRFDYDPTTLVCKGLLIEESRQNRLTYSQDFSQSIWAVAGTATKTASASVCPDGTTSAYTISVGTGSNFFWYNSLNITAAARYEPSIYIKRITTSGTLRINSANGTGNGQWTINLALLGNGFERITRNSPAVTVVTEFTGTGTNFSGILFVSASGTLNFEVWGAQVELGTFSTSYIPTTTTALTRNADVATMTGTNFSDWYNQSEGAFAVQADTLVANATIRRIVQVDDGTSNERMYLGASTIGNFVVVDGGAATAQINPGTWTANTSLWQCGAYKQNSVNAALNGTIGTTDTSCTLPTVNALRLGSDATPANFLNGHIQKLEYWPQRLINAEVQAFSK